MNFQPTSYDELKHEIDTNKDRNMLNPGKYSFSVISADERISKGKGLPMIEIKLEVFKDEGGSVFLKDWLSAANPWFKIKLLSFCEATGLGMKYTSGELNSYDCLGKTGSVNIVVRKRKDDEGKEYNIMSAASYEKPEFTKKAEYGNNIIKSEEDDDLPF